MLNTKDRESYCKSRKEYKNLLKHKKKQYKDRQLSELLDTLGNQSEFWKKVNQLAPKHTRTENNISIDMWYQHFRTVLETDDPVNHEVEDDILGDIVGDVEGDMDLINEPITKDEVTRALISLKNGKAPGPDGIIGEVFKTLQMLYWTFLLSYSMKYLIKEYILKTGQTQSFTLYTKKVTQIIQIITGVYFSLRC